MRITALVVILSTMFAVACAPKEQPVTGEVFIVTKGGNNIKLGLVPVAVYTEQTVNDFIAKYKASHEARVGAAEPAIKEAQAELAPLKAANDTAIEEVWKSHAHLKQLTSSKWSAYYEGPHKRINDTYEAATTQYLAALNKKIALIDSAMLLSSGESISRATPVPLAETKTNSDGKFSFMLKPGRYGIWARGSRSIGSDVEHYFWFLWVAVAEGKAQDILLSNDNQINSICNETCVVSARTFRQPDDGAPRPTMGKN